MKIIKKLESCIYNYSGWIRFFLVLFWCFFAVQVHVPVVAGIKILGEESIDVDFVRVHQSARELNNLIFALEKRAEKLGGKYSPHDYFEDLKEVRLKEQEIKNLVGRRGITGATTNLFGLSWKNIGNGNYSTADVDIARTAFENWEKMGFVEPQFPPSDDNFWKINSSKILKYLSVFYLRTMFLVFFYYLVRMTLRRGILETFLADKKRFLFAILLWPWFFSRYPFNIINEIKVEAELRRMGNLFRRLSMTERKLVREVAASSDFENWITAFRLNNQMRRSMAIVILPTIIMYLFAPTVTDAKTMYHQNRDGPRIENSIHCNNLDLTNVQEIKSSKKSCDFENHGFKKAVISCLEYLPIFICDNHVSFREIFSFEAVFKKIDHVPIYGCVTIGLFFLTNQC